MSIKKAVAALSSLIIASAMVGCTTEPPFETETPGDGQGENQTKNVVFSFGQSVHPFFIAMETGARAYAEEHDINLTVTSADYRIENQVQQIEDSLTRNIDGLLVNPVDSEALANSVTQAMNSGVPVIPVDINVVGAEVTSFVASDNLEIGRQAAAYIAEAIGEEGDIALIGAPQVTSTNQREQGFLEALNDYPDINLVATSGEAMQRETSLAAAETILEANPNLKAVFGVNESSALGAMSAVQARGSDIIIVGVDATPDLLDAIEADTPVRATIAQDPYQMGYIAMELMDQYLNGQEIEPSASAPIDLVTDDNVQEFIDREAAYNESD